jgi:hypothetical protein
MKISLLYKKIYLFLLFLTLLTIYPAKTYARKIDYFAKPQIGLWGGIITPVYTTYDRVRTDLGAGLLFRYQTPLPDLKIGIETAYLDFKPKGLDGVNTLTLVPVYGNFVYRLPIMPGFPLTFQVKAGIGGTWIKIRPDRIAQWDPIGTAGFEMSFSAGRNFNVGTRVDYLFIYESHIKDAERNGHLINAGLEIFFNITL